MGRFFVAVLIVISFLFLAPSARAAVLFIKSVGGISTPSSPNQYKTWVSSPTIVGVTLPNAVVNIVVDGNMGSVSSDGSGNWNYTTGTLILGNHTVSVASASDSLTFTITIIVPPTLAPTSVNQAPRRLPVTAGPTPIIGLILAAGSLLATGIYLRKT